MRIPLAAAAALLALAAAGAAAPPAAAKPRPHVVMLVLDEFPTTSLLGRHRRIDRVRFPNLAALAGDATWFRNATTVADSTAAAMPALLDGRGRRSRPGRARPPRRTLMDLLARHGYRVRASDESGACPARWCGRRRPVRYYLIRHRVPRVEGFIGSIGPSRQPTLWFKHVLLPHVPWQYLPSGNQYLRGPFPPIRALNSDLGSHSRTLVRLAYQRHLLQAGAVDHLVGRLVAQLKATGLYDRTLIVITADHGVSFRLHENDRRTVTPGNVQGVAPVPLIVKRPGQRRGRISRSYARLYDVLPTIADVLRVRVPWRTNGRSAFSRAVGRRRTVSLRGRHSRYRLMRLSARRFQGRWSRAIRYQHGRFGYGRSRRLYAIGPRGSLIGRRLVARGRRLYLGSTRVRGGGRLRARLYRAFEWSNVVFARRRFRPALVTGQVLSRRPRAGRPLAVVVNGRVAATSFSFRLRGRRAEQFGVLVPEERLVPGRNSVLVLTFARRGKRLRFRLLASI